MIAALTRHRTNEASTTLPSAYQRFRGYPRLTWGETTEKRSIVAHKQSPPPENVAKCYTALPVLSLEFTHECHQRVDPVFGKRVIDRCPHAAHGAMSLEPIQTCRGGLLHERILERFGRQAKRHVHQRSAVAPGRAPVETSAIDLGVELRRLARVRFRDCFEPSLTDQPLHHQAEPRTR